MTDRELELQLRAWYRREIHAAEVAPASLRAAVQSIPVGRPETGPSAVRLRRPTWLLAAAVLLVTLLVVGAIAVGSRNPPTVTPLPSARLAVPPEPSSIASLPLGTVGSWVMTASMPTFRDSPTPTVLMPDGRVLFVGGDGTGDRGDPAATSAELYDPTTGTWTATGNLRTPRRTGHTATLLDDGRVLVTGGSAYQGTAGGPYPQDAAEVYDPITGAWTSTGRMTTPRSQHDATLLPDGTVLATDGYRLAFTTTLRAEIYDPRTGTWALTTSVPKPGGPATLLPDGTVLVVGGTSDERYDPVSQRWTTIASPDGPGCAPNRRGTLVLADGSVLVLCGSVFDNDTPSAALLDPARGSWTTVAAPPRRFLLAIALLDGRVLVGDGAGGAIYDPTRHTWTAAGLPVYSGSGTPLFRMSGADSNTLSYEIDTATPLRDGRLLMTIDQDAIVYTPVTAP
jgi:hypothetical protein